MKVGLPLYSKEPLLAPSLQLTLKQQLKLLNTHSFSINCCPRCAMPVSEPRTAKVNLSCACSWKVNSQS